MGEKKILTRKRLFPVFLILMAGVIGITVWLGILSTQRSNVFDSSLGGNNSDNSGSSGSNNGGSTGEKDPEDAFKMGTYRFAGVAADEGRCSEIGTRILAKCGSVVDAAIATMLCIGVLNTHSSGVGGGSFMTYYNRAEKKVVTFDFREVAPGAATPNMYKGNSTISTQGGLAVGVPGEIMGYWVTHQKYGKLPWKELFEPTIKLCVEGAEIGIALSKAIAEKKEIIESDAQMREIFVDKHTGKILKQGDTMFRPKLAKTLRTIADEGASAFYNGSLSQDIVDDIKERGGIITLEDLRNYKANEKEPIVFDVAGMKVYSVRPPSSGAILGFILNILDGYNMDKESLKKDPVLTYHRITEAFKFAYAKRTSLGDEDFVNISSLLANLTNDDYADDIRSKIWDNMTQTLEYYGPTFLDRFTTGTSHGSFMASNGDALAITSTINTYFGATVRGSRTGIFFNNEMDDFSSPNITNSFGVPASPANFIKPGKRPLSSMCPAIFIDNNDDVRLVIGASGGTKITTSTAYVAMRTLWFEENIKSAIDARRIHHQLLPPFLQYENGFSKEVILGLEKKLHNVSNTYSLGSSNVQGIQVKDNTIYAYSDFRKGGYPDGY